MNILRKCASITLGALLATAGMSWSGDLDPAAPDDLFAKAEARVGRPLTPVSYAGVARRTTRRAAASGAYAAPPSSTTVVVQAPASAPTYPPECVQSVDSTGATVYRCP